MKIAVIITLFSEYSWDFFNKNLFQVFVDGTDYLLSNVIGISSSTGNVFAFIDPIFDKYTNDRFWALLAIQLLQIQTGLMFFAIMALYSILLYFRAILEVIISYCLAFLGLAVLISLAPFFISFILFERTRNLFESWISSLFNYMIQPTVLLVFFLLIDQLMSQQITDIVVRACWGILIPLKFGLDLNHMGIPLSFSFELPFLPGIPFYVSQVKEVDSAATLFSKDGTFLMVATGSLLFFAYAKMSAGLIDYVNLIVQSLTNVIAARQDGRLHKTSSPVSGIINDMKKAASPITGAVSGVGKFGKRKFIDQKYDSKTGEKGSEKEPDYSGIRKDKSGGGTESDSRGDSTGDKKSGGGDSGGNTGSDKRSGVGDGAGDKDNKWQAVKPGENARGSGSASNVQKTGDGSSGSNKDKDGAASATGNNDKSKFALGAARGGAKDSSQDAKALAKSKADIAKSKADLKQLKADLLGGKGSDRSVARKDATKNQNENQDKDQEAQKQKLQNKDADNQSNKKSIGESDLDSSKQEQQGKGNRDNMDDKLDNNGENQQQKN